MIFQQKLKKQDQNQIKTPESRSDSFWDSYRAVICIAKIVMNVTISEDFVLIPHEII